MLWGNNGVAEFGPFPTLELWLLPQRWFRMTAGVVPSLCLFLGGERAAEKCSIGIGAWIVSWIWSECPGLSRVE